MEFVLIWSSLLLSGFVTSKCQATYVHDGIVCDRCTPGSFVRQPCALDRPTICSQCPEGSYSNSWNALSECKWCRTECPEKNRHLSVITKKCTSTHDIVCSCKEGFWFDSTEGRCLMHSECPPGHYVKHNGTQTSDVVCEKCEKCIKVINLHPGNGTNQDKLIAALASAFGILTVALFLFITGTCIFLKRSKIGLALAVKSTFSKVLNCQPSRKSHLVADHTVDLPLMNPLMECHTNVVTIDNSVGTVSGIVSDISPIEKNVKAQVHATKNIYMSCADLLTTYVRPPAAQCNWPEGKDFEEHQQNEIYKYGNQGGYLVVSPSATLNIPPGAISPGEVYGIKGFPVTNVQEFVTKFEGENERLVAPIFQYDVDGGKPFKKHVRLRLEHCVVDADALDTIKVYYCPSFEQPSKLTQIPRKCKKNNIPQETFYEVDTNGVVSICTKHFSVFVVSGKVRDISVEARIYRKLCAGKHGIPRVRLRVYLSDYLVQSIKEYELQFNKDMRSDGYVQEDKKELRLPNSVTPETKFLFSLHPKNLDCISSLLPPEQCKEAADFAGKIKPVDAAEWIMENKSGDPYFEADLTITATSVPENGAGLEESKSTPFYLSFSLDDIKMDLQPIPASIAIEDVPEADWSNLVDVLSIKMLERDTRPFGRNLSFDEGEIDSVEKRSPNQKEEVIRQLCMDWRQRYPHESLSTFKEALAKLNLKCDARNEIENIMKGIEGLYR